MTPHKSHDRGSYLIDRVFPGVGRVRRASGTTDPRTYRELDAMLTILSVQGRHDLLEGLRDGKLKAIYVFTWFRQSRIDRIPTADVLPALKATWDQWAVRLECSDEHRRSIGITGRAIGILAPHILSDLPALVADYAASGPRRMLQLARAHAMAFVRDTLGPSHRLWAALKDVRVPKQAATRKGRPLSREEVRDLLKSFGDDGAGETWAMVVTGMHQKEYWGDWAVTGDRVAVKDRPTRSHEYLFLLSKAERYHYNAAAISTPAKWPDGPNSPDAIASPYGQGLTRRADKQRGHSRRHAGFNGRWDKLTKDEQQALGANARSVWTIATQPYPEAHFATFPEELARRCILAGSAPGDTVLDPFSGSGTTSAVAVGHGRNAIGIELNPAYRELAQQRIGGLLVAGTSGAQR